MGSINQYHQPWQHQFHPTYYQPNDYFNGNNMQQQPNFNGIQLMQPKIEPSNNQHNMNNLNGITNLYNNNNNNNNGGNNNSSSNNNNNNTDLHSQQIGNTLSPLNTGIQTHSNQLVDIPGEFDGLLNYNNYGTDMSSNGDVNTDIFMSNINDNGFGMLQPQGNVF